MKVNLVQSALYDFDESKCKIVDHELFRELIDYKEPTTDIFGPKVALFKNKKDYMENAHRHNLNIVKEVMVNEKGQIFCYYNDDVFANVSKESTEDDE